MLNGFGRDNPTNNDSFMQYLIAFMNTKALKLRSKRNLNEDIFSFRGIYAHHILKGGYECVL